MASRRQFLRFSLTTLLLATAHKAHGQTPEALTPQIWIPLAQKYEAPDLPAEPNPAPPAESTPEPEPDPTPPQPTPEPEPPFSPEPIPNDAGMIVAPASGSVEQAVAWLAARAQGYTPYDLRVIVEAYQRVGEQVGMDWFLAIAQCAHETGHLTSFWSQRPQRNPAGLGVTGQWQAEPPANRTNWAYNTQRGRWEVGISFPTWAEHGVPAHLGRLLAYALRDDQAEVEQRDLIAMALVYRGLPAQLRGVAPSYIDLNGRWAVPGTDYGQRILDLAQRMRNA